MSLLMYAALAMAAPESQAIDAVLDALHAAATEADAETYFGLFSPDAVFIGTDATERWSLPEFRAWAAPHFEEAPAWAYATVERSVTTEGRVAWFDERLEHERYGAVRGSGVLVRTGGDWRIAQYVLSFPVPNEVAPAVVALVTGDARLPTPFTAAQIRDAYVPGLRTVHRMTEGDAVSWRASTVLGADEERVSIEFQGLTDAGQRVGEPELGSFAWTELREHASFAAGATEVAEEEVTVPFGTVACRKYVVREGPKVKTFWFAPDLAGPPVRMTIAVEGAQVFEMALVSRAVDA